MRYQLQYNRYSGISTKPDWHPMPEGRGIIVQTRAEAMQMKRNYFAACRRVFGEIPAVELRIAEGAHCIA